MCSMFREAEKATRSLSTASNPPLVAFQSQSAAKSDNTGIVIGLVNKPSEWE